MCREERAKSYFYNMRKFHNYIKRQLYSKYTKNKHVLELAIGKFGDLGKLINAKKIIGYDIDESSIQEAKRRLGFYKKNFTDRVSLNTLDLSENVIDGKKNIDVISCMFAIHYFFKSQETFDCILQSINNNIKQGGILMITVFDGERVRSRLRESFSDKHFRLTLKKETGGVFGNCINVCINDNDTLSPNYNPDDEYIVDIKQFIDIMDKQGFSVIEKMSFEEKYLRKFDLSDTEMDLSFLNTTLVFKKIN